MLTSFNPSPCGVFLDARVSRFRLVQDSSLSQDELGLGYANVQFDPLEDGSLVVVRQTAMNRAGISSELLADPIGLDATRPHHPQLSVCQSSEVSVSGGKVFQRTDAGIELCWASPGFQDDESGLHALEWQLSRQLDSGEWNVKKPSLAPPPLRRLWPNSLGACPPPLPPPSPLPRWRCAPCEPPPHPVLADRYVVLCTGVAHNPGHGRS